MILPFTLIGRLFKFMATRDGKRPTTFLSSVIKPNQINHSVQSALNLIGWKRGGRKSREKQNQRNLEVLATLTGNVSKNLGNVLPFACTLQTLELVKCNSHILSYGPIFCIWIYCPSKKKKEKKNFVQQLITDHENETRLARYLFYLWGKISIQTNFKAKNSLLNWPHTHTLTERHIKCNYLQPFQSIQILLLLIASINSVLFWLEVVLLWQYYLLWEVAWQKAFSDTW